MSVTADALVILRESRELTLMAINNAAILRRSAEHQAKLADTLTHIDGAIASVESALALETPKP